MLDKGKAKPEPSSRRLKEFALVLKMLREMERKEREIKLAAEKSASAGQGRALPPPSSFPPRPIKVPPAVCSGPKSLPAADLEPIEPFPEGELDFQ